MWPIAMRPFGEIGTMAMSNNAAQSDDLQRCVLPAAALATSVKFTGEIAH